MNDEKTDSPTVNEDSQVLSSGGKTSRRLNLRSCLLKIFGLGILCTGAGILAAAYFTPPKPEPPKDLKVPTAVNIEAESSKAKADPFEDIPLTAITRGITQTLIDEAEHPLIPLLKVAREGLKRIEEEVQDYRCIISSQVSIDNAIGEVRHMSCKIRHQQVVAGKKKVPLSIYTKFLSPESLAGQEAIWVRGRNKNKIVAHGAGMLNIKRIHVRPDSSLAMRGNRYSMPNLGMKQLIKKMIEKGENDLKYGECEAKVKRKVEIDSHQCTMLEIKHPQRREHFEFHIARIYIDDVRNLPIAYEGFLWPEKPGQEPPLLEKYYYTDIELNVGLTNNDFSPNNKEYSYPRW